MLRCDHCLLEFPERDAIREGVAGVQKVFCCTGCRGVYQLIVGEGLERFYGGRRWEERGLAADPEAPVDVLAFNGAVRNVDGVAELDLYVDGIRCASCVWLNERLLQSLPGVRFARVNYATHRARVRWDPGITTLAAVVARIRSAGYDPKPYSDSERLRAQTAETRDLLIRVGTAFFLSSQLMIYSVALYAGYFQGIEPGIRRAMEFIALGLALPVFFYAGAPFLRSALRSLRACRFNMDSLVVLGSGAALAYSLYQMTRGGAVYFDTSAMIITLILAGRYVEARARGRASEAVARLGRLLPADARVVSPAPSMAAGSGAAVAAEVPAAAAAVPGTDGERVAYPPHDSEVKTAQSRTRRVPLGAVRVGDLVEVAPGEHVPLDGIVVDGASEVDEALLTGEARPVKKSLGAAVIGGTTNLHGAFTMRVSRTGDATVLSGIIRAVERAQDQKPRIQAVADRVTGFFVPVVLVLALGAVATHLLRGRMASEALMVGVSVVVIACPCSLGLATPIAVLLATGAAGARGILVKGLDVLESAAAATTVIFDKTGTLTRGRPVVREIVPAAGWSREEVIAMAAAVERRSEHGVAGAILAEARSLADGPPEAVDFRVVPGRGVTGEVNGAAVVVGNPSLLRELGICIPPGLEERGAALEAGGDTVVYVARAGEATGQIVVADALRDDASDTVAALTRLGLSVAVVSGDASATTAAVSARAGVERAMGETTPEGKALEVARLQEGGARVLFVGDGINDAPALTQAAVGVAMGRGTDVTLESADAVLIRDDLRLAADLVGIGRRTRKIVRENVFWAFFYNIVAIPLAVTGRLHPIVAAGAMAASSLFVVGNSLRVRSWKSAS